MLNCDDGADRGYFRNPTAQSNRIGAEASVTRADVLSYRGNGQPAVPNKTKGFILTFMQVTLASSKRKIAFDFPTVVHVTPTGPTSFSSSLKFIAQWGN